MQSTPPRPYVVTVIPETPREASVTTVSDLLVGALGLAGLMLSIALLLGVGLALIRIVLRRLFPPVTDHMPSVSPLDPGPMPPTSQPR